MAIDDKTPNLNDAGYELADFEQTKQKVKKPKKDKDPKPISKNKIDDLIELYEDTMGTVSIADMAQAADIQPYQAAEIKAEIEHALSLIPDED